MAAAPSIPETMRAVQYTSVTGGLENNLHVTTTFPLPKTARALPAGSTLVKVTHASLNPADYKFPELPLVGRLLFARPCVPGADFAGTVVQTTVPHLTAGQTVFGRVWGETNSSPITRWGSLGEYIVVPAKAICAGPEGVAPSHLACLGTAALTAYQAIAPYTSAGDRVLVNGGSGGVGTFAIQVAVARGCRVTAVCSAANADLCRSLGAENVIDYGAEDVLTALNREGPVYAHVLDAVCSSSRLYFGCHGFLKPGGVFVSIGGDTGWAMVRDTVAMACLPAFLGGGKRSWKFLMVKVDPGHWARLAEWMREAKVKAVVAQEFDLENAADAFRALRTKRTKGKLVVRVASD